MAERTEAELLKEAEAREREAAEHGPYGGGGPPLQQFGEQMWEQQQQQALAYGDDPYGDCLGGSGSAAPTLRRVKWGDGEAKAEEGMELGGVIVTFRELG